MGVRRGLLLIISSPSGAGKSTLARMLLDWDPTIAFSISATTRKPREGELDARDYFFYSEDQFRKAIKDGQMLEYAEVFGRLYGSPLQPVEAARSSGRDVLFDIDWQGTQQIRNSPHGTQTVSVFVLPPSIAELERRLRTRGLDSDEVIMARMQRCMDEISHWAEYDFVLVNDDLQATFETLKGIVVAERMRRELQPGLSDFVRGLDAEFRERA